MLSFLIINEYSFILNFELVIVSFSQRVFKLHIIFRFLDLILEINGQINRFSKVTGQLTKWAIQHRTAEFSSAVW